MTTNTLADMHDRAALAHMDARRGALRLTTRAVAAHNLYAPSPADYIANIAQSAADVGDHNCAMLAHSEAAATLRQQPPHYTGA